MNKAILWTKDFLILTCVHFFIGLNFYLLMVIISVHAIDGFGASPSEAGLAASIFVVGSLVGRLFTGELLRRTGPRKMLYGGLIFGLVMSLLYFGANGIIFLISVRFFHGISFGIAHTAATTIAANIIPRERTGEGMGYYMLATTLATGIGPFLAMFINQRTGFNMIFAACAISAVLALVGALFLTVPEAAVTEERHKAITEFNLRSVFEPRTIPIAIFCGLIYFSYSSVLAFLSVYSRQIRLTDAAGFFFVVYAIAVLISRPHIGRLVDSKGENSVMYPSLLMFLLGMLMLSRTHQWYVLLTAAALIGIGTGGVQSISQAVSVKMTPPHRLGLATSTFWIFNEVGIGMGPFILGLFVPYTGYRGMYACMASVSLACALLYYTVHGRKARRITLVD
jgi:MFS family permease